MRTVIHFMAGALGIASTLGFVGFLAASRQYFDPDRHWGDRLFTLFFPDSEAASDFVGIGWRLRVASRWCFAAMACFGVIFVLSD